MDDEATDPGDRLLSRVRRASLTVLGDSPAGNDVLTLCNDHARARRMILDDRAPGATVVAIVGATGQGKSWLTRQLVLHHDTRQAIPSGNAVREATERLVWIGPSPPADLDPRRERYLHVSADQMMPMGGAYVLVDTPGATDDREEIADTARRALSLAAVLVMVVRRDQMRSQTVSVLTALGEGTLVVPVINAVREPQDPQVATDADALVARMRKAAPSGTILAPVLIPDFDLQEQDEATIGHAAAQQIAAGLQPYIGGTLNEQRRQRVRLAALESRFRQSLHATLAAHLPEMTRAVEALNAEAERLPRDIAQSLVGGGESLRAGIRSRLRLSLMTHTAAIWFPYRTLLGLLNLTHGAWDRLVLSLSGSLPSLITAAWTGAQNLRQAGEVEQDIRDGLRRRSAAAVADRLGPSLARFHDHLRRLSSGGDAAPTDHQPDAHHSQPAYLAGIDALQEESQRIFDQEIERRAISGVAAAMLGLIGTAIFWALMAGPVVSLYRRYATASYDTIRFGSDALEAFPHPDAAMLLTSLLLSLLPTALFAMLVLTWAQRAGSVRAAEQRIRQRHDEAIARLQQENILRLRWDDPQLADAEFLLNASRYGESNG